MDLIGKTIGKYKILSEIGQGGMGVVYLGEHTALPKRFALKFLLPAFNLNEHLRSRFIQEGINQAKLVHPNIVQVTDFFQENDLFAIVMEYVEGPSLAELIEKKGRLSEKEALPIFKHVLSGLDYAHRKGIIHRDIKPSNVLIDKNNEAKIMDFGISIESGQKRLTLLGSDVGTPCYMSPEQIVQPKSIDHRSDVYAMGILLFEMLTGRLPFEAETDHKIKEMQCRLSPPAPSQLNPDISATLSEYIVKAMSKNPDDRFNGCGEFLLYIQEYETFLERYKKSPVPKTPTQPADSQEESSDKKRPFKKKNVLSRALAALSVLIILGLAAGYFINASGKGGLIIESSPTEAKCYLNNHYRGMTRFEKSISKGIYSLEVKKDGYKTHEEKFIQIEAGETVKLVVALKPSVSTILTVQSDPSGADFRLDGKSDYQGTTDKEIQIEAGAYSLTVAKEGYEEYRDTFSVKAGERSNVIARLKAIVEKPVKEDTTAILTIESDPSGADFRLDGESDYQGTTDKEIQIEAGAYSLTVAKEGYKEYRDTFSVKAGERSNVIARLKAIVVNGALAVSPEPASSYYRVQIGAFNKEQNAIKLAAELNREGFDAYVSQYEGFYRVQCGLFTSKENANNLKIKLAKAGYQSIIKFW